MNSTKGKSAYLRNYSLKIAAGVKEEFGLRGSMLRVISASVPIFFEDRQGGNSFYLEAGEEVVFNAGDENVFYNLDVYHNSGIEQTVIIAVGENARIGSTKVSGNVTIQNNAKPAGAFNNTAINVTTASGQVLAANANRKSLMIQNKSATGTIWVFLSSIAGAATQLNGIRLAGGQMLAPDLTHTGFVTIIGDIATNPDVLICEA